MKNQSLFKRIMLLLVMFLVIGILTYGFLMLCNWSPYIKEWTGFSRFILGVEGVVFLLALIVEFSEK
jgi:hypothetical protein